MQTNNNFSQALDDQDKLQDMLCEEKTLIGSYGTLIPEAACPQLREVLTRNFTDCTQNQFAIFDQMNQLGWYPTKAAAAADINAARDKFTQLRQQLG